MSEIIRKKRLLYRANHRGFKEMDILLGGFAKTYLDGLSGDELDQFETLLGARDHDIYDWVTGKVPVPVQYQSAILDQLRSFRPIV